MKIAPPEMKSWLRPCTDLSTKVRVRFVCESWCSGVEHIDPEKSAADSKKRYEML